MVIKTNYANKIYIKHQKKKWKINNIHYKMKCFKKTLNEILNVNNVY